MGELIRDRYESLGVIGRGGQGEVLKCLDRQHDRLVAIKARTWGSDEERAALTSEARILLDLRPHESLPIVREDFFEGDRYYLVMDWIDGRSLQQVLDDQGDPGLPASSVLEDLTSVADALDHLHSQTQPVVHGDVKPANIIRTPDGHAVLVDFGIARLAGADGTRAGTAHYAAPEVATGKTVTPASDIYSLGATAFALLTGRPPEGIRPSWEGVPAAGVGVIERAVRRALAIDPKKRPAFARELVEQLHTWMEAALPSGTVTFLVTEIANASDLWTRDEERMKSALERYAFIFGNNVEADEGVEVRVRGARDGRSAVFTRASSAARCAAEFARAVSVERWATDEALMIATAIHTGEAEVRAGEYLGPAVSRASSLLGLAHGGQILLSRATVDLVREALPEGATLHDLGSHRLRDLAKPEQIVQLLLDGMPSEFPALASLDVHPNNLPLQLTSFVGREAEMSRVSAMLEESRLVTLIGMGGSGKTRIALQVGAEMMQRFGDGTWLVDLGRITDPALVAQAVASAVGVREHPGRSLEETLTSSLQDKTMLIILDNCEHLVGACAVVTELLLRGCPNMRVLATSRERLAVAGESVFPIPSLSLPGAAREIEAGDLVRFEAVRLFADRAMLANPNFALSAENAEAVVKICRRLDGIPLAIELAAARTRAMSPQQIHDRLDDRFRILSGTARTALPRQQTLRATVDWSYELLTEEERMMFRRAGVFVGGFLLESAEKVCSGKGIEEWQVLDLIVQLLDKSLLVADESASETRYRMLQTVQQYARERLDESGEARALSDRHSQQFLSMAERGRPELVGNEQSEWLERFEAEHDNFRAALAFGFDAGGENGLRLASALAPFWEIRGYLTEGRTWVRRALDACTTDLPAVRATVLDAGGSLALMQGDYEGALRLWRGSLDIVETLGDRSAAAEMRRNLGNATWALGRFDEARGLYEKCLSEYRDLGDPRGVAISLNNLGLLAWSRKDYAASRTLYEESLAIKRGLDDKRTLAVTINNLGQLTRAESDLVEALRLYKEALALRIEIGDKDGLADSLEGVAGVLVATAPEKAARLFGAAEALREAIASPLPPPEQEAYDRDVALARSALGRETYESASRGGRDLTLEAATQEALEA